MSQYVVDKDGKKTHVLLTIEEYEQLIEDLHDNAVVDERKRSAELISFNKAKEMILNSQQDQEIF